MFPFLTAFMIFIVVTTILRTKATRDEKARTEAFWNRENEANNTRRADLSLLSYYSFPCETLPAFPEDPELSPAYEELTSLCKKRMLNLNGLSNTDLKLKYGPQNLEELTVYGDNFAALESALLSYGKLLNEKGKRQDAEKVLEKGIALPTELMENYELLAAWYREEGADRKLQGLKSMAEANLQGYAKDAVIKALSDSAGRAEIA